MSQNKLNLLRYPGGKQRFIKYMYQYLPFEKTLNKNYFEPFLGSGAIFFELNPSNAVLSDINSELIELFKGIYLYPSEVWKIFKNFPNNKKTYYSIRDMDIKKERLAFKAARTLYLNRTCFKGMWRHNSKGKFNVGYGGEERRWVIKKEILLEVSNRLKNAKLIKGDFETSINLSEDGDFIYLDPPYKPGEKEVKNNHYVYNTFAFNDYLRLANSLIKASKRGVKWAMTITSHKEILSLFFEFRIINLKIGTGDKPGVLINNPQEVLILNY